VAKPQPAVKLTFVGERGSPECPSSTRSFLYSSSNGDRWLLLHNIETGNYIVRHEPNLSSGGQAADMPRQPVDCSGAVAVVILRDDMQRVIKVP
jgi:hypothetical protein